MPSPKQLASGRNDWQTPSDVIDLIEHFNQGVPIGLDPCGAPDNPTRAALNWYPPEHDGLKEPWEGRGLMFCNPPYNTIMQWAMRAASYGGTGTEVILLAVPRTDTAWFRYVWKADALAFWHGCGARKDPLNTSRLRFVDPETGKAAAGNTNPSVFAYWGPRSMLFGRTFSPYARVVFP